MDILTAEPTVAVLTCLNCTMMSFESSMSLNIPSSLLVNAAPHSEETPKRSVCIQGQDFLSVIHFTLSVCCVWRSDTDGLN